MKFVDDKERKALYESELGQSMLKAQEASQQATMSKVKNEIGKDVIIAWNPFTLKTKYPFAEAISKEFNKMLDNTIPKNTLVSSRFQSWINKERNELMIDSKINRDEYFKQQIDFNSGEVVENKGLALVQAKLEYLNKQLSKTQKAFITHMQNNSNLAFADKEECEAWKSYYMSKQNEVQNFIERNDFSHYNIVDKDGNIKKEGNIEDVQEHQKNLQAKIEQVELAQQEAEKRMNEDSLETNKAEQETYFNKNNINNLRP
ncbi:hypothetical protein B0619_07550 [Campylobacter lari]|nr:hypothetical protein [Campylobacter lari]EAK5787055.1 hypothetical protein [Campylobacter lari]